jgi:hypothetical protein
LLNNNNRHDFSRRALMTDERGDSAPIPRSRTLVEPVAALESP